MSSSDSVRWDVFISYATEDGDEVAYPLARLLQSLGCSVWIDRTELQVGDSLRRKIDEGLARSRFGVVVLSHAFFGKHWPNHELSGLLQLEVEGRKVILPIWHKVTAEEVRSYSPPLADRVAAKTSDSLEMVAIKILEAVRPELIAAVVKDIRAVEQLPRLENGQAVARLVLGAHMLVPGHSPCESRDEAELVARFFQTVQDFDAYNDLEMGERVLTEYNLVQEADDFMALGWELFGIRELQTFVFAGKSIPMDTAMLVAAKGPNATVLRQEGRFMIGLARPANNSNSA